MALLVWTVAAEPFAAQAQAPAPAASVPSVDLVRYGGKWFEIASFPMFVAAHAHAYEAGWMQTQVAGTVPWRWLAPRPSSGSTGRPSSWAHPVSDTPNESRATS